MKITGEGQAELFKIAAIAIGAGLAIWYIKNKAFNLGSAAGDLVNSVVDSAKALIDDAGTAINTAADKSYDAVFKPTTRNDGWQYFPLEGIVIDDKGRYWRGTKIIWSPDA